MILVGIGAIIGSGWLFASGLVASIAGPAGWISWVIGGSPCSCSVWSTLNWAPRFRGRVNWCAIHSTHTALWSVF